MTQDQIATSFRYSGRHKMARQKMETTPTRDQEEDGDSPRRVGRYQGLPQEENKEVRNLSCRETVLSGRSAVPRLLLNWMGS